MQLKQYMQEEITMTFLTLLEFKNMQLWLDSGKWSNLLSQKTVSNREAIKKFWALGAANSAWEFEKIVQKQEATMIERPLIFMF